MAATVEERLAQLEARVDLLEQRLNGAKEPRIGITIEEARERLKRPAERGPEQLERFRRVIGSFDGPEDLSEHMREYLNGERE